MATASERMSEIDASTLKTWMDSGEVFLVDVRDPAEASGERISGTELTPLSGVGPEPEGRKIVLYCRTGKRSSLAGQQLLSDVGDAVWHLEGGIEAWKAAGYDIERTATAPICLPRQGQMIAGALVLVGSLLSAIVSPWFLCLCGVVGVGLIFFGCTDTCGMAGLLAKLSDHQHV